MNQLIGIEKLGISYYKLQITISVFKQQNKRMFKNSYLQQPIMPSFSIGQLSPRQQSYNNNNTRIGTWNKIYDTQFQTRFDIKDDNLQRMVNKLIEENQRLYEHLNKQKEKNFDLLELKRKLEDEIKKLQFEMERISTYENLTTRQGQVRKYQIIQDKQKLQTQLDNYFEENSHLRTQVRKWANECEQLTKQKQQLVNQNVILLSQMTELKEKVSNLEKLVTEYEQIVKKSNNTSSKMEQLEKKKNINHFYFQEAETVRSANEKFVNSNLENYGDISNGKRLPPNIFLSQSPKSSFPQYYQLTNQSKIQRQQNSTNPSDHKIVSFRSPFLLGGMEANREGKNRFITEDEPSPRSFQNEKIQQKLEFLSPPKQFYSHHMQSSRSPQSQYPKSPSVYSYANRVSPMIKIAQQRQEKVQQKNSDDFNLQLNKKQLKDEVWSLRNELISDLISKSYKQAVNAAEREKKNCLKIFISSLEPKINTLGQMVLNYQQARSIMNENCPSSRLKWTQNDKYGETVKNEGKNTDNIGKIYESIKNNLKKQQSLAGQYLALFRYLTLLDKIEGDVDLNLIECIKHSALKQIFRIKKLKDHQQAQD